MKRITGIRPTGRLHIGHYFSVIKPAIEYDVDVLIADYHAPDKTYQDVFRFDQQLMKIGIDKLKILVQSNIFNSGLYFQLLNLASAGELNRMTQYKSSKEKTAHLFVYPVLMAHDIAGYDEVYVGDDQEQHIEFVRTLLKKAGLKCPEAKIVGGRVMNLRHPEKKMSKSEPNGCLFLDEDPTKKIMKAVTDESGLKNLHFLYKEFVGGKPPSSNEEMKKKLIEGIKENV